MHGGIAVHPQVHGRRHVHRAFCAEPAGQQQVVAQAMGHLGQGVRRAGATSRRSAQRARCTWSFQIAAPPASRVSSVRAGRRLRVESTKGDTNSFAEGVSTTCTSAPAFTKARTSSGVLYAAMPPATPSSTLRGSVIASPMASTAAQMALASSPGRRKTMRPSNSSSTAMAAGLGMRSYSLLSLICSWFS
jgi:hypothetical protein